MVGGALPPRPPCRIATDPMCIEVLRKGYILDIFRIFPSGQQPCSRAAMYSGDWGKSLFTSLISYAGS